MFTPPYFARAGKAVETAGGGANWLPALLAALLWALTALVGGYVILHWVGRQPHTPVAALAQSAVQADASVVALALGAALTDQAPSAVVQPATARFQLLGFVRQPGHRGVALIAVDGQPARPVAVGAKLDGEWRLLAVDKAGVQVGQRLGDPASFSLRLPDPVTASAPGGTPNSAPNYAPNYAPSSAVDPAPGFGSAVVLTPAQQQGMDPTQGGVPVPRPLSQSLSHAMSQAMAQGMAQPSHQVPPGQAAQGQ